MRLLKYLMTSLALLLISINLSGCVFDGVTAVQTVETNISIVEHPKQVQLNNVHFYVVNESNFEEFKDIFIKQNGYFVFTALSIKDYENLSLNVSELSRYIQQQKNIILYYEKSITESKGNTDANK